MSKLPRSIAALRVAKKNGLVIPSLLAAATIGFAGAGLIAGGFTVRPIHLVLQ